MTTDHNAAISLCPQPNYRGDTVTGLGRLGAWIWVPSPGEILQRTEAGHEAAKDPPWMFSWLNLMGWGRVKWSS